MYGASMPAEACVAPMPAGRSSTICTAAPRRASSYAAAHPTIPAPMTMMSEGRDEATRALLSPVEVVPVQDCVEHQRIRALRLPAPERAERKHHDVPAPQRFVDQQRAVRQLLTV